MYSIKLPPPFPPPSLFLPFLIFSLLPHFNIPRHEVGLIFFREKLKLVGREERAYGRTVRALIVFLEVSILIRLFLFFMFLLGDAIGKG